MPLHLIGKPRTARFVRGKMPKPQGQSHRPFGKGSAGESQGWRRRLAMVGRGALRLLWICIPLAAVGAMGYALLTLPYFSVQKVTILGLQRLTEQEVLSRAAVAGQNIFTIDTHRLGESLGELPPVKDVSVRRRLPREVVLEIQERQPWALWRFGQTTYAVDTEGMVLYPRKEAPGLLSIVQTEGEPLGPGSRIDPEVVRLAQRLQEVIPEKLGVKVKGFEYRPGSGLTAITERGWRARFGDGQHLDYKLVVWQAILAKAPEAKIPVGHVDLRFPTRPFARP